ncbi:hypothetical protein pdam_00019409, partial [Pocillopora damicornis]
MPTLSYPFEWLESAEPPQITPPSQFVLPVPAGPSGAPPKCNCRAPNRVLERISKSSSFDKKKKRGKPPACGNAIERHCCLVSCQLEKMMHSPPVNEDKDVMMIRLGQKQQQKLNYQNIANAAAIMNLESQFSPGEEALLQRMDVLELYPHSACKTQLSHVHDNDLCVLLSLPRVAEEEILQ